MIINDPEVNIKLQLIFANDRQTGKMITNDEGMVVTWSNMEQLVI